MARPTGVGRGICHLSYFDRTTGRMARRGRGPSTLKRHQADLRARTGLTTEQAIYAGRAAGWLIVTSLEAL